MAEFVFSVTGGRNGGLVEEEEGCVLFKGMEFRWLGFSMEFGVFFFVFVLDY